MLHHRQAMYMSAVSLGVHALPIAQVVVVHATRTNTLSEGVQADPAFLAKDARPVTLAVWCRQALMLPTVLCHKPTSSPCCQRSLVLMQAVACTRPCTVDSALMPPTRCEACEFSACREMSDGCAALLPCVVRRPRPCCFEIHLDSDSHHRCMFRAT